MGWNTNVVFVERGGLDQLLAQLPDVVCRTNRTVDLEAAASATLAPHLAIGRVRGWAVVWDPNGRIVGDPERLRQLSSGTRAISLQIDSVTGSYSFAYFAEGVQKRRVDYEKSAVLSQTGTPRKEEKEVQVSSYGYDESYLFALAQRMTAPSLSELDEHRYDLLELS